MPRAVQPRCRPDITPASRDLANQKPASSAGFLLSEGTLGHLAHPAIAHAHPRTVEREASASLELARIFRFRKKSPPRSGACEDRSPGITGVEAHVQNHGAAIARWKRGFRGSSLPCDQILRSARRIGGAAPFAVR